MFPEWSHRFSPERLGLDDFTLTTAPSHLWLDCHINNSLIVSRMQYMEKSHRKCSTLFGLQLQHHVGDILGSLGHLSAFPRLSPLVSVCPSISFLGVGLSQARSFSFAHGSFQDVHSSWTLFISPLRPRLLSLFLQHPK